MTAASTRPETAHLMPLYRESIAPQLEKLEGKRRRAAFRARIVGGALIGMGVVASVVAGRLGFRDPTDLLVMFGGAGFAAAMWLLRKVRSRTKAVLVTRAFESLGWTHTEEASKPPHMDDYTAHRLLPRHDSGHFEDHVRGRHAGADFDMREAKLTQKRGKRTKTVFQGCILSVDFHQPFHSTTVVLRDRGVLNRSKLAGLKRVGMASPKWENMFEAYGTDQVEARVKLDPGFMERLMALEESVDGKKLRFGFFDNRLHVVVETANRFEPGSMFKPLADPARMEQLIGEIEALMAVVEGVRKPGQAVEPVTAVPAPEVTSGYAWPFNPYDPDGVLLRRA